MSRIAAFSSGKRFLLAREGTASTPKEIGSDRIGRPLRRGGVSVPGVDVPVALRSSDEPGVALGAEPPNGFVVQEQLAVSHGP